TSSASTTTSRRRAVIELEPSDVAELRGSLTGELITPPDDGYERARVCFNALIDRRPTAIARCADAKDVAAALDFAQSNGLQLAVRGGGHNPAGHCVLDDGLVIDLTRLRGGAGGPQAR